MVSRGCPQTDSLRRPLRASVRRGLSQPHRSHDGEGVEVAEEKAVLEYAVAEEREDADGIGLVAKADERLEAREI